MKPVDKRIQTFIREHHILTLAVTRDNKPWCATCFYVYIPETNRFIFTSDHDTRHIRDVVEGNNYFVAGTIALETRIVGKIRGIQFSGTMMEPEGEELKESRSAYLKRFPIARLATLHLWVLEPAYIKMTDNRLGFGTKLVWE
ncbi:MAG: pyridoxamine 5'-phosphate oxidase family protein [bacterium]